MSIHTFLRLQAIFQTIQLICGLGRQPGTDWDLPRGWGRLARSLGHLCFHRISGWPEAWWTYPNTTQKKAEQEVPFGSWSSVVCLILILPQFSCTAKFVGFRQHLSFWAAPWGIALPLLPSSKENVWKWMLFMAVKSATNECLSLESLPFVAEQRTSYRGADCWQAQRPVRMRVWTRYDLQFHPVLSCWHLQAPVLSPAGVMGRSRRHHDDATFATGGLHWGRWQEIINRLPFPAHASCFN